MTVVKYIIGSKSNKASETCMLSSSSLALGTSRMWTVKELALIIEALEIQVSYREEQLVGNRLRRK